MRKHIIFVSRRIKNPPYNKSIRQNPIILRKIHRFWEVSYMVKFGERLKAARTSKHMSQQALADIIGKSLNTVGLYERGLRQPSLETLCLLADTLDVSCDYLLARTEAKKMAKVSEAADENLAIRVSRIENHLGLD